MQDVTVKQFIQDMTIMLATSAALTWVFVCYLPTVLIKFV